MAPLEVRAELLQAIVDRSCSNPITTPAGITVRCHSRLKEVCPGCSNLAAGDWAAILRSGIFHAPSTARFLVVTLTAPSFGATHRVVKPGRTVQQCQCGAVHDPTLDADLRGTPLDLDTYDYEGAIWWNYASPALFDNFIRLLRDIYPSLAYAAIREWQARGSLHLHVLMRIDAAEMPTEHVIETVACTVSATVDGGPTIRFGDQIKAEVARADGQAAQTIFYLTKAVGYVTKDLSGIPGPAGDYARAHHERLTAYACEVLRCPACPRTGPDSPRLWCAKSCHRRWGARSHVITTSRGSHAWSLTGLTREGLKRGRAEWARQNAAATGNTLSRSMDRFAQAVAARTELDSITADRNNPAMTGDHATYPLTGDAM
jgi:hypothetical protein